MLYEFASPGWMAFMHGMMCERVAALGEAAREIDWSICEVFTDPPKHLSPDGSALAWCCIVRGGEVEFSNSQRTDVDFLVVADYAAILPVGRYDTRGEADRQAELAAMAQDLVQRGLMRTTGDRARRDPRLGNAHDAIARVTA